jgi:hypothetical protein
MKRAGIISVVIICLIVISAVSWHSIEEIHYLKTFYPKSFTVEEAYYASKVELVKVAIISIPLLAVILAALFLIRNSDKAE